MKDEIVVNGIRYKRIDKSIENSDNEFLEADKHVEAKKSQRKYPRCVCVDWPDCAPSCRRRYMV